MITGRANFVFNLIGASKTLKLIHVTLSDILFRLYAAIRVYRRLLEPRGNSKIPILQIHIYHVPYEKREIYTTNIYRTYELVHTRPVS